VVIDDTAVDFGKKYVSLIAIEIAWLFLLNKRARERLIRRGSLNVGIQRMSVFDVRVMFDPDLIATTKARVNS
jgi:hypothetical protein